MVRGGFAVVHLCCCINHEQDSDVLYFVSVHGRVHTGKAEATVHQPLYTIQLNIGNPYCYKGQTSHEGSHMMILLHELLCSDSHHM